MSRFYLRLCAAVAVVVSLLGNADAQGPKTSDLRGRVEYEHELVVPALLVELADVTHAVDTIHTDVAADGSFTFRNLPYGDYVLRITNYGGNIIAEQFVSVHESQAPLEVKLPRVDAPRPGGPVSMNELRHPPSAKALDAIRAGQNFTRSGDYEHAADALRKAVRLAPEFAPAHSNLAVQYIRLHQFDEALTEITRALSLAGPNPLDLCNLAFVRTALRQYDSGAEAARQALRMDPNLAGAHYILGTLLLLRAETRPEAIAHLRRAAETMQSARESLERLHVAQR